MELNYPNDKLTNYWSIFLVWQGNVSDIDKSRIEINKKNRMDELLMGEWGLWPEHHLVV